MINFWIFFELFHFRAVSGQLCHLVYLLIQPIECNFSFIFLLLKSEEEGMMCK